VDLTQSYVHFLAPEVLARFEIREVRNAAGIIASTSPDEWGDIVAVLDGLKLTKTDVLGAGGSKSDMAKRFDGAFREMGWREGRVDTSISLSVTTSKWKDDPAHVLVSNVNSEGYKVDNFKGRIALDFEWNAKDGNLDRDIGAYRALYDAGVIDAGVIVTRTLDLRDLALQLDPASKKFDTTTTTNLTKLEPRMTRGDAGGCPILAVAISRNTYTGH
jgi:hypothetical protein